MPKYIALFKLTDQGITSIKDAPQRFDNAVKTIEAMGGKLTDFYATMGEYDYVGVAEWPNDEAAMTFLLALGAQGNIRTTTLKAFDTEQFREIVNKLP